MSEAPKPVTEQGGPTVRVTPELHRRLLVIQFERRMSGDGFVSLNDIIAERFADGPVKP